MYELKATIHKNNFNTDEGGFRHIPNEPKLDKVQKNKSQYTIFQTSLFIYPNKFAKLAAATTGTRGC